MQVQHLLLTGRHPAGNTRFPAPLLKSLCAQLDIEATVASVQALYSSERTLGSHREWVRKTLGFRLHDVAVDAQLRDALGLRANDASSRDELVAYVHERLYDQKVVIPGKRTVDDLTREAFQAVEDLAARTVRAAVVPARLRVVLKTMFEDSPKEGATVLEWLKLSAGKDGPKNLHEVSSRIDLLKTLGVHLWDLSALSESRIHAFARKVIHRPPSETSRRLAETQAVEIICFLRFTLHDLSDEAANRASRQVTRLVRMGTTRVLAKQASRAAAYRAVIESIGDLTRDKTKKPTQRLAEIEALTKASLEENLANHASVVRDTLVEQGARVKGVLRNMECLDICGEPDSPDARLVEALRELRDSGAEQLPHDFDTSFIDRSWKPLVNDPDRLKALRAFEACALTRIRKGLLGGRLWIHHSTSFRSRSAALIPEDEWTRDKDRLCEAFGLERDPKRALELQYALLEAKLQEVQAGLAKGLLEIDKDGCVRLPAIRAEDKDPDLERTNQMLFDMIGTVQFPDLIVQVDARTKFSTALLGREPQSPGELTALYAALLAHGTDIDAKGAAAMIPGVAVSQVTASMRLLETPGRLRKANDLVVEEQQRQPIVQAWSDGAKASSDMMALDATRHLGSARADPRRRTMATGLYTHKLGSYPIIHDEPIVLLTRQGGPAVEGVHQYNAGGRERVKVQLLAVDTHGYTYPAMSIAKGLKFDLCPQMAHLPDQKLWVPRGFDVPEALERVALPQVSEKAIVEGWDAYLRLIASILQGRVSVTWALARNGSAARGDTLWRALDQYGRLLRSIYLCDYFTNPAFRREIKTLLSRGESVHQLQRAVHAGRIQPERGRRRHELKTISGSHVLLTNLVIAWNTIKLQSAVERLRTGGQRISDDILRHIGPVHFGHVNFRGTMSFGIERYAAQLLAPGAAATSRRSAPAAA